MYTAFLEKRFTIYSNSKNLPTPPGELGHRQPAVSDNVDGQSLSQRPGTLLKTMVSRVFLVSQLNYDRDQVGILTRRGTDLVVVRGTYNYI